MNSIEQYELDYYKLIDDVQVNSTYKCRQICIYFKNTSHRPLTHRYIEHVAGPNIDTYVQNLMMFGNSGNWEKLRHMETQCRLLSVLNDHISITTRMTEAVESIKQSTECDRRLETHLEAATAKLSELEKRNEALMIHNKALHERNKEIEARLEGIIGAIRREITAPTAPTATAIPIDASVSTPINVPNNTLITSVTPIVSSDVLIPPTLPTPSALPILKEPKMPPLEDCISDYDSEDIALNDRIDGPLIRAVRDLRRSDRYSDRRNDGRNDERNDRHNDRNRIAINSEGRKRWQRYRRDRQRNRRRARAPSRSPEPQRRVIDRTCGRRDRQNGDNE